MEGKKKDFIFGTRTVIEAIKSGKEIDKVLIQKNLENNLARELVSLIQTYRIPYSRVPVEKLKKITRKNHQGVICFLSAITYASLDHIVTTAFEKAKPPFLILLDRITDVRNFGAIARSAECAGVHAIIIPSRGAAQINSDAMKTSAGSLNFIPVCREKNLKKTLEYLKSCGIQVIACTEKTDELIYQADFTQPTVLILGSEKDGISPEYLKLADQKVKIPLLGHIDSLNVSVATGIVLYEAVRQKKIV